MRVTVYGMDTAQLLDEKVFEEKLYQINVKLQENVQKCRQGEDKLRRLAGYLLLEGALRQAYGEKARHDYTYERGQNGKPWLREYPDFQFNLSHSGSLAVCAAAKKPVGVDVQKIGEMKERIAARFYTKQENELLNHCTSKDEQRMIFYRLWSAKEAYVKWNGNGLGQGIDNFTVSLDTDTVWETENGQDTQLNTKPAAFLSQLQYGAENSQDRYCIAVCGKERIEIQWLFLTESMLPSVD